MGGLGALSDSPEKEWNIIPLFDLPISPVKVPIPPVSINSVGKISSLLGSTNNTQQGNRSMLSAPTGLKDGMKINSSLGPDETTVGVGDGGVLPIGV